MASWFGPYSSTYIQAINFNDAFGGGNTVVGNVSASPVWTVMVLKCAAQL